MREENRSEIIHDALNFLDDELIEEVDKLRGGVSVVGVSHEETDLNETGDTMAYVQSKKNDTSGKMLKQGYSWKKWAALAASICLLVVAGNAWEILQENVFNTGNSSSGDQAYDDMIEGDMEDFNQSGLSGTAPDAEDDKYGLQDNVEDTFGEPEDMSRPQTSEAKPNEALVKLQNYTAVYFAEVKNENPTDDYMMQLSEEDCEILVKFLDSLQRGTTSEVDVASQFEMKNKADGQLIFELEDGTRVHLILVADGMVYSEETPNVWIQMDKRVYKILLESLKENS